MDILTLIKSRRSIRKYQKKPVPKELMEQVMEAGFFAPSSMDRQPWRFTVVSNPEKRALLAAEAKKELAAFLETDEAIAQYGAAAVERFKERAVSDDDAIFHNAPVIILIIQTLDVGSEFDFGLAAQNMMLCAHGKGLGTCAIGLAVPLNRSAEARALLSMKPEERIVMALCLGYPDESPHAKDRTAQPVFWLD